MEEFTVFLGIAVVLLGLFSATGAFAMSLPSGKDSPIALRSAGFAAVALPVGTTVEWSNPATGNSGQSTVLRRYQKKVYPDQTYAKAPRRPGMAYDGWNGFRAWFPLNQRPQPRVFDCVEFTVASGGINQTFNACHTNRMTWIVNDRWILSPIQQNHSNPSCMAFRFDVRLDRGRVQTTGSFCRTGQTKWQAHP
jgi:hypothetical protein